MIKKHFLRISTLFLFCLAVISAAHAGIENSPQVNLSFEKSTFDFNEKVPVRVSISNQGKGEIKILRWFMPIDGITENLFSVTLNGSPVEYTGAIYKRTEPTEFDYLILKPGQTVVRTVNLADYYDLSQSGYYEITYRAESYDLFTPQPNFQQKSEQLKSESVAVWIYGTAKKLPPNLSNPEYTTIGCNATQTSALPPAVSGANGYAANSLSYLNAGTVDTRYTTWFGTFDATRYSTVRTHFLNIRNLLVADNYRIACNDPGCGSNTFAFVYPSDTTTHTIYVCNVFFSVATTGTDSKAGTIIHEMSHFNDIAGTNDFVYGQTGARNLAVSNPNNAINNADNHEYFAEAGSPILATATISGRVLSTTGRGVGNVIVTLLSSSGVTLSARTNPFGYYRFSNIGTGQNYTITGKAKRFSIESRVITVSENLSDINLSAVFR